MMKIIEHNNLIAMVDEEALVNKADSLIAFEYDRYVALGDKNNNCFSREEFDLNVENFKDIVRNTCKEENVKNIIDNFKKKKNGTFSKNKKHVVAYYNNTVYVQNWSDTWYTYELRFIPSNDTTLVLEIVEVTTSAGKNAPFI